MAMALNGELENSVVLKAVEEQLKIKLRKHFEKQAAPVIEEMMQEIMVDLKIGLDRYVNPMLFEDTVRIILDDRRKK